MARSGKYTNIKNDMVSGTRRIFKPLSIWYNLKRSEYQCCNIAMLLQNWYVVCWYCTQVVCVGTIRWTMN